MSFRKAAPRSVNPHLLAPATLKLLFPHITDPKRKGEWAEGVFKNDAFALDFNVSKPWGDSAPYDAITEKCGRMFRIQIRSSWDVNKDGFYSVHACDSCKKSNTLTALQTDFFACLVVPFRVWYIVPVSAVDPGQYRIYMRPYEAGGRKRMTHRSRDYEQFRERWDLLA